MQRMMSRLLGALLLGLFAVGLPACQQQADTPENRLEAARKYQQVSPLRDTLDNAIRDLSQRLPPEKQKDFIQFMQKHVDAQAVEQKAVKAMADHFTLKEIQALTRFYGSPEGRAVNQKYGEYMAAVMPTIQSQLSQSAQAWLAQQTPQQKPQPEGKKPELKKQQEPPSSRKEPGAPAEQASPTTPQEGGKQK